MSADAAEQSRRDSLAAAIRDGLLIAGIEVALPHRLVPNDEGEHIAPGCDDECHGYRISGYPCRCSCHNVGPW